MSFMLLPSMVYIVVALARSTMATCSGSPSRVPSASRPSINSRSPACGVYSRVRHRPRCLNQLTPPEQPAKFGITLSGTPEYRAHQLTNMAHHG